MLDPFFKKLRPSDLVAILIVIYGFRIIATADNPVIGGLLTSIVGFYFTYRLTDDNSKD